MWSEERPHLPPRATTSATSRVHECHLVGDWETGGMQRRDVVILGSTGSIGTQALDVVRANPDRFRVVGLTAGGGNPELFEQQVAEFAPAFHGLGRGGQRRGGRACRRDVVLNGITGAVGLRPTLAALDAGSTLALANKESLIVGGPLVTAAARSRARSCRSTPSTRRSPSACAAAPPTRCAGSCSPRSGGPFRGRTPRRARRRHRRARRWPTRPGTWARSSRSTPRRWSTRASR